MIQGQHYKRTLDASHDKFWSGEHVIGGALWQIALTYASMIDAAQQVGAANQSSVSSEEMIGQALRMKDER